MSATLPNLEVLAKWLDATLYQTDFRPVPLKEYLKIGKNIYNANNLSLSHTLEPTFTLKVINCCVCFNTCNIFHKSIYRMIQTM